jgi:hypothetical protein
MASSVYSEDVESVLRWLGFGAGIGALFGTVVAVMKTLLVPRRSWSFLSSLVGRLGFRFFHGVAVRLPRFDLADRFLGFFAPAVVIGILASLLAAFVFAFALLLLPWADLTLGEALRESGSSIFTLGFVNTAQPVPTTLDVVAGAIGMIFVALTIGYLPSMYAEVRRREALVKQLEGWTGTPSWGPEILARFALASAVDRLPRLYATWDEWCAYVADSHMKYPTLTHYRLPRSGNHYLLALLAVMDAAALDMALRPGEAHVDARLFLRQAALCLRDIAYPMRRIDAGPPRPLLDQAAFSEGAVRAIEAGFPAAVPPEQAWEAFADLRSQYAPLAHELAYWILPPPAPWTGTRRGFPNLEARPPAPETWDLT